MLCNELPLGLLNVFKVFDALLTLAKVLIPLIIIVMTIIDFSKTSMGSNLDEMKKVVNKLPLRLVVGIMVFLLPNIINLIFDVVSPNIDGEGLSCLLAVDDGMITNAKYYAVQKAFEKLDEDLSYNNLDTAKSAIDKLDNKDVVKTSYMDTYNRYKTQLDNKQKEKDKQREDAIGKSKIIVNPSKYNESTEDGGGGTASVQGGNATQQEIVNYALQFVGMKYIWNGPCGRGKTMEWCKANNRGTDCSGFAKAVYQHFGYDIGDAYTGSEIHAGKAVSSLSEAQPGDLIFYSSKRLHHVAIYLGNNRIVEEQSTNKGLTANRTANHESIRAIRRIIN